MNTPTSNRPGIVCRWVRRWSAVGGDPEAGGFGTNHIAHCAECARFFASGRALDSALKRDAAGVQAIARAGLEQRIVRAVQLFSGTGVSPAGFETGEISPRRPVFRGIAISLGAAAAIAVMLLLLQKPDVPSRIASETVEPARIARDTSDELPANLPWDSFRPAAAGLLARNPLEEEAAAVYSDARSAVQFLAMNFLPLSAESVPRRASGG